MYTQSHKLEPSPPIVKIS